jgi:hypothetical protein
MRLHRSQIFFFEIVCGAMMIVRNKEIDLSRDTLVACHENYHLAIRGGALVARASKPSHRISRRFSKEM